MYEATYQTFKPFVCGFDTRNKTILPLINRMINDILLYSLPCFN